MDELIKQEKLTDTQIKRREQYIAEEKINLQHTRYPVRNDRRPLQRDSEKVQEPRLADRRPPADPMQNSYRAYEERAAARRSEFMNYEEEAAERPRARRSEAQQRPQPAEATLTSILSSVIFGILTFERYGICRYSSWLRYFIVTSFNVIIGSSAAFRPRLYIPLKFLLSSRDRSCICRIYRP